MPCLAAVDRQLRIEQNCWALVRVRGHPDTFCRNLIICRSRCEPLLSAGNACGARGAFVRCHTVEKVDSMGLVDDVPVRHVRPKQPM